MGILKTLGKGMGYSLIFTLMTLMFTLLTFPEDRLREYIEVLASDATGGRVSIADLSLSGIGGVELTDMALKMPAEKRPEGGDDRPGGMLQVQRLEADAGLFSLLDDVLDVHFSATVQGGEITGGHVIRSPERVGVEVDEIADLRLGAAGLILKAKIGADLRGTLGGKALKVAYGSDMSTLEAELDLDLSDARLVDPIIPTKQLGPLSLSTMSLGQVQLTIKAGKSSTMGLKKRKRGPGRKKSDETVIHLANVGASGGDVEFQFDEKSLITIPPKAPMKQWGVDIHAAVRVKDAYIDFSVEKNGEIEQPNRLLKMYFQQDARMRAAMRDGVFGVTCKGTFDRPNCRPTPTTIRGFKKRQPRFTGGAEEEEEEEAADKEVSEAKEKPKAKGKKARSARTKENLKSRSAKGAPSARSTGSKTARAKRPMPSRVPKATPARDPAPNARMNPVPMGAAARAVPTIVPPSVRGRDEAYADDEEEEEAEEEDEEDEEEDEDEDDEDEDEDEDEEDEDDEEDEEGGEE